MFAPRLKAEKAAINEDNDDFEDLLDLGDADGEFSSSEDVDEGEDVDDEEEDSDEGDIVDWFTVICRLIHVNL